MSEDIRLPEVPFEFNGKTYKLRCNMNVLAEIQENNGGKLPNIFDENKTLNNFLLYLSAMMNDYADEQGWEERVTAKELGRKLSITDGALIQNVMTLVVRANYIKKDKTEKELNNSKN